jgi:transcriptional regulator with XRE-family HTH domain
MLDTALDAGVSPETLRKIETGRIATPAFPTIAAIADVLGLSLDAVWADMARQDSAGELARNRRDRSGRLAS